MKKYITNTENTCWSDCLACLLEIEPERVPKFVKLYGEKYMNMTRVWLKKNFRRGLVYIPARAFMETGGLRLNGPIGPEGYSIVSLSMVDDRFGHAAIAFNGGILYDNGDDRSEEYGTICGYFVMYDLEPAKVTWVKRPKKVKKYEKRIKR